jgi:hypothetical protein
MLLRRGSGTPISMRETKTSMDECPSYFGFFFWEALTDCFGATVWFMTWRSRGVGLRGFLQAGNSTLDALVSHLRMNID